MINQASSAKSVKLISQNSGQSGQSIANTVLSNKDCDNANQEQVEKQSSINEGDFDYDSQRMNRLNRVSFAAPLAPTRKSMNSIESPT